MSTDGLGGKQNEREHTRQRTGLHRAFRPSLILPRERYHWQWTANTRQGKDRGYSAVVVAVDELAVAVVDV